MTIHEILAARDKAICEAWETWYRTQKALDEAYKKAEHIREKAVRKAWEAYKKAAAEK